MATKTKAKTTTKKKTTPVRKKTISWKDVDISKPIEKDAVYSKRIEQTRQFKREKLARGIIDFNWSKGYRNWMQDIEK